MNDLRKETIKIALCNALATDKDLMQKEIATNFGTDPVSITYIKNPTYWHLVNKTLWADLDEWRMSGKKLRGYIPPRLLNAPPETAPEPAPEPSIYDKLEEQHKKAVEKKEGKKKPEPQPEPKPEPLPEKQPEQKEPSVTKGAKKFLKDRRECEQLSESVGKQIEGGKNYISSGKPESTRKLEEKRKERKKGKKLFNEKLEGKKKSEPKADTKPEEKSSQKPNPDIEFDKAMKEAVELLNSGVIIPIPMSLHGPNSEPNVISQKFDIEVEVRLSVKEKK